jgi:hypothetical protein
LDYESFVVVAGGPSKSMVDVPAEKLDADHFLRGQSVHHVQQGDRVHPARDSQQDTPGP